MVILAEPVGLRKPYYIGIGIEVYFWQYAQVHVLIQCWSQWIVALPCYIASTLGELWYVQISMAVELLVACL